MSLHKAVSAFFSLTLLISGPAALMPAMASAAPGSADCAGTWENGRWADGKALEGGEDAKATVKFDWEAASDAVIGESFDLELPVELVPATKSSSTGIYRGVEMKTSEGELGATGSWSSDGSLLTMELLTAAQPGETLGGTASFDVTWADTSTLTDGAQTLRFGGCGDAVLKGTYTAPVKETTPPATTPSPTTSNSPSEKPSTSASSSPSASPTTQPSTTTERGSEPSGSAGSEGAGEQGEKPKGGDDEEKPGDDDPEPARSEEPQPTSSEEASPESTDTPEAPKESDTPNRNRPAVPLTPEAPEASRVQSVLEMFSAFAKTMSASVNSDIVVTIPDGAAGFETLNVGQAPQIWVGSQVWIKGLWDATTANPKPGDQFTVGLPPTLQMSSLTSFPLLDEDGVKSWGTCVVTRSLMTCTLNDSVVGFEEIKGTFRLLAMAYGWVAPGQGLDLDINGETTHSVLPGDGGIKDNFVQPAFNKKSSGGDPVSATSTTHETSWNVEIPGKQFVDSIVNNKVVISGTYDSGGLGSSELLTSRYMTFSAGRDSNPSALPGAKLTFTNIPGGNGYTITIDVTDVDPAMLTEDIRYKLNYAIQIGSLTSNRYDRTWTIKNTVTLGGSSTSDTYGVIGPRQPSGSDKNPIDGRKSMPSNVSGSSKYPGMVEVPFRYQLDTYDLEKFPESGTTAVIRDTFGSSLQFCNVSARDKGLSWKAGNNTPTLKASGSNWFEFTFDYFYGGNGDYRNVTSMEYTLCMPLIDYVALGDFSSLTPEERANIINKAGPNGSQAVKPNNPMKTGLINASEYELGGKTYAPNTTMNYDVAVLSSVAGWQNVGSVPYVYEDDFSTPPTLSICEPSPGADAKTRLGVTYRWYQDWIAPGIYNNPGTRTNFLDFTDYLTVNLDEPKKIRYGFTGPIPAGDLAYIAEHTGSTGRFVIEYTMCTSSGGQDPHGTKYVNKFKGIGELGGTNETLTFNESNGSGTGQGVQYGSVSVSKKVTPNASNIPAGTTFSVLFEEFAPGVVPGQGNPAASYVRKITADGAPVSGLNARGPGWTIRLTEPTVPTISGVNFGDPVFSGGEGVTILDGGKTALIAATPATNVEVTLTNQINIPDGGFVISKEITGDGAPLAADKVFTFDYTVNGESRDPVTITGSGSVTVSDIPAGSQIVVTERDSAVAGTTWTSKITNGEFTIGDNAEAVKVTAVNEYVTLPPASIIGTTASLDNDNVVIEGGKITDIVELKSLAAGDYTLEGQLYCKTTGQLTSMTAKLDFTVDSYRETDQQTVTFDITDASCSEMVVYETLKDSTGKVISEHKDPNDPKQTVGTPPVGEIIGTTATLSDDNVVKVGGTITDVVELKNLVPGDYTLEGQLFCKTTGQLTNMTATQGFTVSSFQPAGSQTVTFNVTDAACSELVVFETLKDSTGKVISEHKDPNDEKQTVGAPPVPAIIGTVAELDNDNVVTVGGKITDTVEMKNLAPGDYILTGQLYCKTTGQLTDMKAETRFTVSEFQATGRQTVTFTISDASCSELVVFETLAKADNPETPISEHKDPNDPKQTVGKPPVPAIIGTNASLSGQSVVTVGGTVTDVVDLTGLVPGEYTLKGELMCKTTGQSTGMLAETKFTVATYEATGQQTVTFDITNADCTELVVFESLYKGTDTTPISEHKDIDDVKQTVGQPPVPAIIGTIASLPGDVVKVGGTITDVVELKSLVPGDYTLEGQLYCKTTGQLTDMTASTSFNVASYLATGQQTVTFDITNADCSELVVFETLKDSTGKVISEHKDPNDEKQTVGTPPVPAIIGTNASLSGESVVTLGGTITDVVDLKDLLPGDYVLEGQLFCKTTGQLTDMTARLEFTTTAYEAISQQTVIFDITNADCSELVVFEVLKMKGNDTPVSEHKDPNDPKQTVGSPPVPAIMGTTASLTEGNVVTIGGTVTDTVNLSSLVPGEYTLKGELMCKTTGQSTGMVAETKFTVATYQATGQQTVTFSITNDDCSQLVAFETLYRGGETTPVSEHRDINDIEQTVGIPPTPAILGTTASMDNNNVVTVGGTITDTVDLSKLVPGEYTIKGQLYCKTTGQLTDMTASTTFTVAAYQETGQQKVIFDITDASCSELVVFESLYVSGQEAPISEHNNPNDEKQTVGQPPVPSIIGTNASLSGESVVAVGGKVIDVVDLVNLPAGDYVLEGQLYCKTTGQLTNMTATLEFTTTTFQATSQQTVTFDITDASCTELVVFEVLKVKGKETPVSEHKDPNDPKQTVGSPPVPSIIGTVADLSGDTVAVGGTITDTVSMKTLPAGTYTLSGELYCKTTGQLTGMTASKTFTIDSYQATGTQTVTFDITDASCSHLVVFETLKDSTGKVISEHRDPNDLAQTVGKEPMPLILSTQASLSTSDNVVAVGATVTDTVNLKDIGAGSWIIEGELMCKATGQPTGIKSSTEFTVDKFTDSMTETVLFQITNADCEELVAFETLRKGPGGDIKATHHDINDAAQTVGKEKVITTPPTTTTTVPPTTDVTTTEPTTTTVPPVTTTPDVPVTTTVPPVTTVPVGSTTRQTVPPVKPTTNVSATTSPKPSPTCVYPITGNPGDPNGGPSTKPGTPECEVPVRTERGTIRSVPSGPIVKPQG